MKIAIIGGGITGLAAAYELSKYDHRVTVFESSPMLGGLANGFKAHGWLWSLEYAYHHLFTNDDVIVGLIKELDLADKIIVKRPVTASLYKGKSYQLDSAAKLFTFPGLSTVDKLRTAAILAFLKLYPDRIGASPLWRPLESLTAEQLLTSIGGKNAYKTLWKPLLVGKFGKLAPTVSAAWFWARIKKRTPRLAYVKGGFHTLIDALAQAIGHKGGKFYLNTPVDSIKHESGGVNYVLWKKQKASFDKILLTIPSPLAFKLFPGIHNSTTAPLLSIPHLFAQTLILETTKPILKDVYWLNVTDRSFPFLAAVAHTNFMDPSHYGGRHITYFGNYLPQGHKYLSMDKEQLLKEFMPFIKRIADNRPQITHSFLFVGPFAQPVHQRHYSNKIPPIKTSVPGVYLANMDFIVPWDRGTNYAVELGQKAARVIHHEKE